MEWVPACPESVCNSLPLAASQNVIELPFPLANSLPSGLKAIDQIKSECPVKAGCSLPLCTSHSFTKLSELPPASSLPSGLRATELAEYSFSERRFLPLCTSHSLMVLSSLQLTNIL